MRFLALVGYLVLLVIVAGGGAGAAEALELPEGVAAAVGWLTGLGAVFATRRLRRAASRKRAAARIERDRAADWIERDRAVGERLRREDLRLYRELLGGATDTLAAVDPDAYVGRQLAARGTRLQT